MEHNGIAPLLFDLTAYGVTKEEYLGVCKKILSKTPLNRDDKRVLVKLERAFVTHYGTKYVKSFPKREWCRLSGRQYKVLNEQGERYGLSCLTEPEINLTVLPKQLHDLLAKIAQKWDDLDSEGLDGPTSPWLEKYREQKAKQERIRLQQMRGELLPVDFVTEFWQRACAQIRAAGFKLEKNFGEEAKIIIDEALDTIVTDSMRTLNKASPPQKTVTQQEEKTKPKKRTRKKKDDKTDKD